MTALGAAGAAPAQSWCYRPHPPLDMAPPDHDPELRRILSDEYEQYLNDVEAFLNCSQAEIREVTAESRAVIARWVELYGEDAGMRGR